MTNGLEEELEKQGFRRVAEGHAIGGNIVLQIPADLVPQPGESPVRIVPWDCSLDLKIVDKADLGEKCLPGEEYVVYQRRPARYKIELVLGREDPIANKLYD